MSHQPQGNDVIVDLAVIEEQADKSIRRVWENGELYFSIIDIIQLLTDSPKPSAYWYAMKRRVQTEGFRQVSTECRKLKMTGSDGKQYPTDAANTETLLRLIQSIPSPKAEPVKMWLARVGTKELQASVQPLAPAIAQQHIAALEKPIESAPALDWANYYEALTHIYKRVALFEERFATVESRQDSLEDRLESMEEITRMIPEILSRLGPNTLSTEHKATVQAKAKYLHELSGASFGSIYFDLNQEFHVNAYADILESQWQDVINWLNTHITMYERRML